MKKELDFIKNINIAHRGIHDLGVPENSLSSFDAALKKGRAIEFDVQILKDGEIIVFHDRNLKRMTGTDRLVKDCTIVDINKLRLNNTDERIPTLKEVLQLVRGKVLLDIELKTSRYGRLEEKLSSILDTYNGTFIVKSFDIRSIIWFKINRPSYIRGLLLINPKQSKKMLARITAKMGFLWEMVDVDFLAVEKNSFPSKKLKKFRDSGRPLLVWTIKTKEELKNAFKYADSFLVDYNF